MGLILCSVGLDVCLCSGQCCSQQEDPGFNTLVRIGRLYRVCMFFLCLRGHLRSLQPPKTLQSISSDRVVAIIAKISNCGINKSTALDGKLPSITLDVRGAVETALVAKSNNTSNFWDVTANHPCRHNHTQEVQAVTKLTSYLEEDPRDSNATALSADR